LNLLELRTAVRDELVEATPGFWTDDELDRWINDANRDLTEVAQIPGGPYTFNTAAGTASYDPPSDFLKVRRLEVDDAMLIPLSLDRRMSGSGTPAFYYVYDGKIYLVPTPDAVLGATLWYYKAASTLFADSDTPIIPEQFHRLIVVYAVGQAKRKADDPGYATYVQDYIAGRLDMQQKRSDEGQAERFSVVLDDWEEF